jgi:hypothetical protein
MASKEEKRVTLIRNSWRLILLLRRYCPTRNKLNEKLLQLYRLAGIIISIEFD